MFVPPVVRQLFSGELLLNLEQELFLAKGDAYLLQTINGLVGAQCINFPIGHKCTLPGG